MVKCIWAKQVWKRTPDGSLQIQLSHSWSQSYSRSFNGWSPDEMTRGLGWSGNATTAASVFLEFRIWV